MARISKADIKKWFEAGDQPTEEQFATLIDECYNNDEDVEERIKQWVLDQGYATEEDLTAFAAEIKEYIDSRVTVVDSYLHVTVSGRTYVTEMEELIAPEAPVLTAGGNYTSSVSVTMTCTTDGATIYYTTDGTTPTSGSTKYTAAITLSQDSSMEVKDYTIKAISFKNGLYSGTSPVTAEYHVYRKLSNCTITASGNDYSTERTITITNPTNGVTIYYTTNGTTPTTGSTVYDSSSKPKITSSKTVKAIAVKAAWKDSGVASASFTLNKTLTYIGQLASTITTPTVSDITGLATHYENSSPAGTYQLTTTFTGYIWFCIPKDQTIQSITSGPLNVPYEQPITVSKWKCYRTSNTVVAGNNEFNIT